MIVNSLNKYFILPSENWYPSNVPPPASPYISIDCISKTDEEIIREAVIHTYNIDKDNIRFRLSPKDFEKLRGDYPVRREFPSYSVKLKNGSEKTQKTLASLGFGIVV
jgi:erythronate-4-phosphate dehydrogenase